MWALDADVHGDELLTQHRWGWTQRIWDVLWDKWVCLVQLWELPLCEESLNRLPSGPHVRASSMQLWKASLKIQNQLSLQEVNSLLKCRKIRKAPGFSRGGNHANQKTFSQIILEKHSEGWAGQPTGNWKGQWKDSSETELLALYVPWCVPS